MPDLDKKISILHVGVADKFIPDFINFNQSDNEFLHDYFFFNGHSIERVKKIPFVRYTEKGITKHIFGYLRVLPLLLKSDRIIMHGMFDIGLVFIFLLLPFNYNKIVWAIWGGDLYDLFKVKKSIKEKIFDKLKISLISKIGYVTTTIPGDYDLLIGNFRTKAIYVENIMYPSHFYREVKGKYSDFIKEEKVCVQIGNSSDPRNNHLDVLERISDSVKRNISITLPMSYGDKQYSSKVEKYLKDKDDFDFFILKKYLTYDEYNNYLSSVDVAVFNHDRQQAVGNIIALLSLGKKVYIRSDITTYKFLLDKGFFVFDAYDLSDLDKKLCVEKRDTNILNAKKYFNRYQLKKSWNEVYVSKIKT
ncbi:TDP-N-acetylfucosamine:lipid II N-acetylfucosaminyltransferase [Vibrio fluvialis]|nr:TDP-N-acetylfucosamine:lipid II N-acetylfucosaminyltransferase [Vibrio fluvialis]